MSYKKQKLILFLLLTIAISFSWYGCSQELEKEDVKKLAETVLAKSAFFGKKSI